MNFQSSMAPGWGNMSFIINGFKELLRYGNLNSRTTRSQLLGAFVVLVPVFLFIGIAVSAMSFNGDYTGLVVSNILRVVTVIVAGPILLAVVIRRVNDQFPGSGWTRLFSRSVSNSPLQILKFVGLWVLLLLVGLLILWTFWPIYLIILLIVLVLPRQQNLQPSYTPPPPPLPTMKSGTIPPLPNALVTSPQDAVVKTDKEEPAYKQGIFWFAAAAAIAMAVLVANPSLFDAGNPLEVEQVQTTPSPTEVESTVEESPSATPSATPTPTQTQVVVATTAPEQPIVEQPVEAALDPRFRTCGDANASGYGDYISGVDPEYDWYMDRDRDGIVCER